MPDLKAQLQGPEKPPDTLEERAWNYYYKYFNCPASPMILTMIMNMLGGLEKTGKTD